MIVLSKAQTQVIQDILDKKKLEEDYDTQPESKAQIERMEKLLNCKRLVFAPKKELAWLAGEVNGVLDKLQQNKESTDWKERAGKSKTLYNLLYKLRKWH